MEIGLTVSATPPTKRANYHGMFVIHTREETVYDCGPMLAHDKVESIHPAIFSYLIKFQEGLQWMRLVNYTRVKNNVEIAHPHPLTPATAVKQAQQHPGPSVLQIDASPCKCSTCKKPINTRSNIGKQLSSEKLSFKARIICLKSWDQPQKVLIDVLY